MPTKRRMLLVLAAIFSIIGIVLSALSVNSYTEFSLGLQTGESFCNLGGIFNCDLVSHSKWGIFLGIPLGAYGLLYYLTIFCLIVGGAVLGYFAFEALYALGLLFSVISIALSIFLFYISKFVIGAICLVCLGMYLANFGILLCFVFLKKSGDGDSYSFRKGIRQFRAAFYTKESKNLKTALLGYLFLALVCLGLKEILGVFYVTRHTVKVELSQVARWKSQPIMQLGLKLNSGVLGDYARGEPNAKVRLVEFADIECPSCRRLYVELKDLERKYPRDLQVVYKNFPLDIECNSMLDRPLHRSACLSAEASRCAGEQGKFWEVLDYLIDSESLLFLESSDGLKNLSNLFGLDEVGLRECLDSNRQMQPILNDLAMGQSLNIVSTPTVYINDKKVPIPSKHNIEEIIKSLLER